MLDKAKGPQLELLRDRGTAEPVSGDRMMDGIYFLSISQAVETSARNRNCCERISSCIILSLHGDRAQ